MSVCLYSCLTYPARKRLRPIISPVVRPAIQYFPHYLINGSIFDTDIDIFVYCNWVVTRWQQYSTHLHTNNTQNDTKQTIHRTTQQLEGCGPCPVLASCTLAFALQQRKKHGKTSVRVAASKNI